jgi:hypothetical protein
MSPRRLALTLVVALMAATGGVGATAARASSSTICVALVIDAHTLGGGVSSSCATVPKGATGVDVLQAAGHRIQFRSDGLICSLDGLPRGGCGAVDSSHYWAYFHRAPGATSWTYSTEGPSTYQPANTATEGWVWDDGETLTPKNVPYSQICKTTPTQKPTHPAPSTHAAQPVHTARPTHPKAPHRATPSATGAASSTTPSSRSVRSSGRHHRTRHRGNGHHSAATTSHSAAVTSPSPSPVAAVGADSGGSSTRDVLFTLVSLVVVAALGGLTVMRFRAQRSIDRP